VNLGKIALFVAMGLFALGFLVFWGTAIARRWSPGSQPGWLETAIGFVTNFLDTLGIGSFAPSTAMFKFWRVVDDQQIPGTLMVGHTPPTLVEAFIFIAVVQVDFTTLALMLASSCIGSWLGAGVVSRLPRRQIRIGMGTALLVAAMFLLSSLLHLVPGGGDSLGLTGLPLVVAILGNMLFGALMTLGIGLYAPCMILVYLLGMNPRAAFPIMMGSCAVLMPVGSAPFIRNQRYNLKAALGLSLGGVPGVLLAAFVVKSLDLDYVRWLVVAVVVYTASMMLRSAHKDKELELQAAAAD
jgi:uncharacterized membrane protein YfcA